MKKNEEKKVFNKGNVVKMLGGTIINTFALAFATYGFFKSVGMPVVLDGAEVSSLIFWFVPVFFILFFILRLAEEFIFQSKNK